MTAFEKMGTLPRQPEWAALMHGFQKILPEAQPGEHWADNETCVFTKRLHQMKNRKAVIVPLLVVMSLMFIWNLSRNINDILSHT